MANTSAVQDQTGHYLARRRLSRALLYLVLAVGAVIAIVPFIYMLETSFKTYGEYGARIAWPAGLTPAPYVGRPRAQEVVVQMTPTDAWQNAPHSFSPDLEGVMLVDKVTPFIQQKAVEDGESLPLQVLILAIDTTNDDTQNYDTFYVTVGSRIIQQFTTRIKGTPSGWPQLLCHRPRSVGASLPGPGSGSQPLRGQGTVERRRHVDVQLYQGVD